MYSKMISQKKLMDLKNIVGKEIKLEVYGVYDTYHWDDVTDHCGTTYLVEGILEKVTLDDILINGRKIPFEDVKTNETSYDKHGTIISLVLDGTKVVYNNYSAVPEDVKHSLEIPLGGNNNQT